MKTDVPRISVIIPARNEVALIGSTVASVLRARERFRDVWGDAARVEVIVVDNASDDGTIDALVPHLREPDVRVVPLEHLGAARARNHGARLSAASSLLFLDADTHLPPNGLVRVAELLERHGFEAGIARIGRLDGGWRARCWWTFWNHVRCLPLPRAKAMPACMFCTRAVFDALGPFDERVAIGEEWPILAELYRDRPRRFIYDRSLVALSSGRRMELQPFGYTRTFVRYVWAVLSLRGRIHYSDRVRHSVSQTVTGESVNWGGDPC
ncbi:MAG: glycosyltransferase [Isosphaeraceae bacterium]